MFKNTASQKLTVLAFADAGHATLDAGEVVTGDAANITCKVEQDDDGTQSAVTDTNPTEVEDGQYRFDLTQAETNGDKLTFYPESSTAGVQVVALPANVIYARPPNFPALGIETDGDLTQVNAVAGAVGSVTGAVGSVTGNVGGNVVGSVASVVAGVTVTTNNDKSGYSISGTLTTLDALDTAQDTQHATTRTELAKLNASVWLDTVNGNDANSGLPGEPVQTVAQAKTLADALNKQICVIAGSSFTIAAAFDSYVFLGTGYTVALGGQSISGTRFENATISGIGTGASRPTFFKCDIGTATLPPSILDRCSVAGTITAGSAGDWKLTFSESGVAGQSAPTFDLASTGNNNLNITNWARGLIIAGLVATDTATANGVFNNIQLDGTGGTVVVSGQYSTLNNNLTDGANVFSTAAFESSHIANIYNDTNADGVAISSATADQLAAALLDLANGVETGVTLRETQRAILSALAGKLAGAATATVTTRDTGDSKNRITATVDADGNRSAVTLDLT